VTAAAGIAVSGARHENKYPTEALFYIEATSSSNITKITFNYQFVGGKTKAYQKIEFDAAPSVKIEHKWNTRHKYVIPGSEIEYTWDLEDATGNKTSTDPVRFAFDDTRFKWRSVNLGKITLHWYQGGDDFGAQMLESATRAARQLSEQAGIEVKAPIKIMLYSTQRDMMGVLEEGAHEWTGGRSFSEEGIVVIAAGSDRQGVAFGLRAVPHELSHVIVHRATDNPYAGLPRWLDEGLAMYAEGQPEPSYVAALNRAISQNKLVSLRSLNSGFPADSDQALLSYAESQSVVEYIIKKYGKEGMSKLLDAFAKGTTPERGLQQAFNINLATLEADWRASIAAPVATQTPSSATPAVPDAGFLRNISCGVPSLGMVVVGLGVVWWAGRRRCMP
jgi:hypothetical protein